MPHERLTPTEPEARHQLLIARERLGRAASLECSLAELDALDAAVARATDGWSRERRVALALTVQKEARLAGQTRGRAAFAFLLARYEHLAQAPPVPEPGWPEPERQLPLAWPDAPAIQPAQAPCEPGATDP